MKILTEAQLRSACLLQEAGEYAVEPGTFVTPLAREFLRDRGITLVERPAIREMPRQRVVYRGGQTYQDAATGQGYASKPENMTHLRGNLLVDKSHPRIALRGQLDDLQAKVLETQVTACREGRAPLAETLQEMLEYLRAILGAEVREAPLGELGLLGMGAEELRQYSHHIPERLGIPHPVPCYTMGAVVVALNALRTQVRVCELAAVNAFGQERQDLIQALNRLSSAVYILICRELAGQKEGAQ